MRSGGFATVAGEFPGDVEKQRRGNVEDGSGGSAEDAASGKSEDLVEKTTEMVVVVVEDCPDKGEPHLEKSSAHHEECRVCQEESDEALINLGCLCRGALSKAHQSCIVKWFNTRGSNKCEICQKIAANVAPPDFQTSYCVWRADPVPAFRAQEPERRRISPLWIASSILVGGLLLDVLVSLTLGVSAIPVNIIIGVIVVLGLGTALRLALELCQEWSVRREVRRVEANASIGFRLYN